MFFWKWVAVMTWKWLIMAACVSGPDSGKMISNGRKCKTNAKYVTPMDCWIHLIWGPARISCNPSQKCNVRRPRVPPCCLLTPLLLLTVFPCLVSLWCVLSALCSVSAVSLIKFYHHHVVRVAWLINLNREFIYVYSSPRSSQFSIETSTCSDWNFYLLQGC